MNVDYARVVSLIGDPVGMKKYEMELREESQRLKEELDYLRGDVAKKKMILFHKWMILNDTPENAERFFHYTDEDMVEEFLKEYNETA